MHSRTVISYVIFNYYNVIQSNHTGVALTPIIFFSVIFCLCISITRLLLYKSILFFFHISLITRKLRPCYQIIVLPLTVIIRECARKLTVGLYKTTFARRFVDIVRQASVVIHASYGARSCIHTRQQHQFLVGQVTGGVVFRKIGPSWFIAS